MTQTTGLGNTYPFYLDENQERLLKAIERVETGNGIVHDLIEVDMKEARQ